MWSVVPSGSTQRFSIHHVHPARAQGVTWAEAGCTWWIENRWVLPEGTTDPMAVVRERLAAGPPAVAGG